MKSSPHRPLILKRWKRSLPQGDSSTSLVRDEPNDGPPKRKQARTNSHDTIRQEPEMSEVLPGIKFIDDYSMPNTQMVPHPPNTDCQNILEALTPKGKELCSNEPNKFILISSDASSPTMETGAFKNENRSEDGHYAASNGAWREEKYVGQHSGTTEVFCTLESLPMEEQELEGNGETSSGLDNSLTNIQWLGKMSSSGLSPCNVKRETEKENQTPKQKAVKVEEESAAPSSSSSSSSSWQESFTERPPYSYMAMIQFAINSTEKKRMMLKDIYTWIEDHFPYFKHVAKPGWKNSIRHNLSLHDMFVRETSSNGKISFWTIHPEANRYLTLDQVFKQQKRHTVDLQRNMGGSSGTKSESPAARRKMKPLLPRVSSYLVPIQFPVSQSLVLPPSSKIPPPTAQGATEKKSNKQVRIAPKVFPSSEDLTVFSSTSFIKEEAYCGEDSSSLTSRQSSKEDACQSSREAFPPALSVKEENERASSRKWASLFCPALSVKAEPLPPAEELNVCLPGLSGKQKRPFTALKSPPPPPPPPPQSTALDTSATKRRERQHVVGKSRRKQHLALSCSEEPVLLLPSSGSSDSSTPEHDLPFGQETCPLGNVSHLTCSPGEGGPSKSPIKEMFCKLPNSSTPSKTPVATLPFLALTDDWKSAPSGKETTSDLDFSRARSPPVPFLSLQEDTELPGFRSTPPRHSLCDSPHLPFLIAGANAMVSGPLTSSPAPSKQSSPELQDGILPENHSLLEGLVLDTMNDSFGKILLDVSFPSLDNDNLGADLSWSHLIPELK